MGCTIVQKRQTNVRLAFSRWFPFKCFAKRNYYSQIDVIRGKNMHIYINIICLTANVPDIIFEVSQLAAFNHRPVDSSITLYWKDSQCSCIEVSSNIEALDLSQLKNELANISKSTIIESITQDDSIEISYYIPLTEIISDNKAFITCFIQL